MVDQARRRLVDAALRSGRVTPWEYPPPVDSSQQYMRNQLDLNEVERSTRFPRHDLATTEPRDTPFG